jgi:rhomboid protease GluP
LSFQDEFVFWRIAHYFISRKEYRIIQLSESQKELWLERLEDKDTQVIRLLLHHLDWSNWMQRDIEMAAANGESIRRQVKKREINVLNIYVTPYPPVDEYQFRIDKPFLFPNGEKTKVTSLLCERQHGKENIEQYVGEPIFSDWKEEYTEAEIEAEKLAALTAAKQRMKSEKALFENGKPLFTYVFLAIQVIIFLLMEAAGGSTTTSVLIRFGAKVNSLILEGEWWRLFTPIFVHIGLLHLVMNSIALYFLGVFVERIFGNIRFIFIYLFAGVCGTIASLLFSPDISAGASGAIMGLFGSLLYFGTVYPKLFFRTMGLNIIIVLGINLAFGFTVSGIDNAGHIGGLIGGFLATAMVHFPMKKRPLAQVSAAVLGAALIFAAVQYSLNQPKPLMSEQTAFALAQTYVENDEYDKAYTVLDSIASDGQDSPELLFLLSVTEIKIGKMDDAKAHLLEAIEKKSDFHEAYYNLAIVYYSEKNYSEAKKYAKEAAAIQPSNADYQSFLKELTDIESFGGGASSFRY